MTMTFLNAASAPDRSPLQQQADAVVVPALTDGGIEQRLHGGKRLVAGGDRQPPFPLAAITVIGRLGMLFTWPGHARCIAIEQPSPIVIRERANGACGSSGSRTPANDHCVFHQANLR